MRSTDWVLIDTETSGLGQPMHCVELAAQRMRGVVPDGPPFCALLNHDVEIEPQAEALHGYSRQFLRTEGRAPTEVHREFIAYAGARPVVAYNLSFDWARVLEPEVRRFAMTPAYHPGFCALTLARRCVHETDGHKLDTLRGHFFPDHAGKSHRALGDLEVTTRLLVEVIWPRLARAGIDSFSSVAEFSRRTPVRECVDRIRNLKTLTAAPATSDHESELVATIEGMLADAQVMDAEVWALKHWLDTHSTHRSELAARSRQMISAAFADGELSRWELDELTYRLRDLLCSRRQASHPRATPVESLVMDGSVTKKRRLSLTKRQLEQETGAELLRLLESIVADGTLTSEEIEKLSSWLSQNQGQDLPAIQYLAEVVNQIVADGKITQSERVDLFLGIEKVLPVTERRAAKAARQDAEATIGPEDAAIGRAELEDMAAEVVLPRSKPQASWRLDPMTDAQSAFIRALGGSIYGGASKGEASDLISALLAERPLTSRQQMVMRFWARDRQPHEGPREISEWMDAFYREDGDRKLAWELFKNESEDDGLQGDPHRVPLGIGTIFLARIKAGGEAAIPKFRLGTHMSPSIQNHVDSRKCPPPDCAASGPIIAEPGTATGPVSRPAREGQSSPRRSLGIGTLVAMAAVVVIVWFVARARNRGHASQPSLPSSPVKTAPEIVTPSAEPPSSAAGSSLNENRAIVRQLRIVGLIGGTRPRVSIEGRLLAVGDVVDRQRGILIHSINAETGTVAFIDLAGEIHSRRIE